MTKQESTPSSRSGRDPPPPPMSPPPPSHDEEDDSDDTRGSGSFEEHSYEGYTQSVSSSAEADDTQRTYHMESETRIPDDKQRRSPEQTASSESEDSAETEVEEDDEISMLKQLSAKYATRQNKTELDSQVERSLNDLVAREGALLVGPPQFSKTAEMSYRKAIEKDVLPRSAVVAGNMTVDADPAQLDVGGNPAYRVQQFRQKMRNQIELAQSTVSDRAKKDTTDFSSFADGPISDKHRERLNKKGKKKSNLRQRLLTYTLEELVQKDKLVTAKKKAYLRLKQNVLSDFESFEMLSYEGTHQVQREFLEKIQEDEEKAKELAKSARSIFCKAIQPLARRHASIMMRMLEEVRSRNVEQLLGRIESGLRKDIRIRLKDMFYKYTSPQSLWTNSLTLVRNRALFVTVAKHFGEKQAARMIHGLGVKQESTVKQLVVNNAKRESQKKQRARIPQTQKEIMKEAKGIYAEQKLERPEQSLCYLSYQTKYAEDEPRTTAKPAGGHTRYSSAKEWRKHTSASIVARVASKLLERIRRKSKEGISSLSTASIDLVANNSRKTTQMKSSHDGESKLSSENETAQNNDDGKTGKLDLDFKILPGAGALDIGVVSARLSMKDYRTAPHFVDVTQLMDQVRGGSEKTAAALKTLGPIGAFLPLSHVVQGTPWYLRINQVDKSKTTKWALKSGLVDETALNMTMQSSEAGYAIEESLTAQHDQEKSKSSVDLPTNVGEQSKQQLKQRETGDSTQSVSRSQSQSSLKGKSVSLEKIQSSLFKNRSRTSLGTSDTIKLLQTNRRLALSGYRVSSNVKNPWKDTGSSSKASQMRLSSLGSASTSYQFNVGSPLRTSGQGVTFEDEMTGSSSGAKEASARLRRAESKVVAREKLEKYERLIARIQSCLSMGSDAYRDMFEHMLAMRTPETMQDFLKLAYYTALGIFHLRQVRATLKDWEKAQYEISILHQEASKDLEEVDDSTRKFMWQLSHTGVLVQPIPLPTWNYIVQQKLNLDPHVMEERLLRESIAESSFNDAESTTGIKNSIFVFTPKEVDRAVDKMRQLTEALHVDVDRYERQLHKNFGFSLKL
eukprot:gb/GECG01007304.1/.p1 GENE.gb/GECG01007304.1/~~gb/GECG01007304.1/.p1  ORF type:complete len:1075 (+),score=173.85 gb/GECG01007304.1/:1-3225(+)